MCIWTIICEKKKLNAVSKKYWPMSAWIVHWHGPKFCAIFNSFPNKLCFLRVCSTSLLKTLWEKEKLLVTSNFSFSRSVFYPFGELSAIFIKLIIVVCKLSVWKSLKIVVWERVKFSTCQKAILLHDSVSCLANGFHWSKIRWCSPW